MISTRQATAQDVEVLYEMIRELAVFEKKDLATLPVSKESLEKYGFGENPCFYAELAENANGVIGYALYSYAYSANQGAPFLFLDDLYIRPSARNQGAGFALFQKMVAYAKNVGCCRIEWLVFDWNDKALTFYEKIGGTLRKDLLTVRLDKNAYTNMLE